MIIIVKLKVRHISACTWQSETISQKIYKSLCSSNYIIYTRYVIYDIVRLCAVSLYLSLFLFFKQTKHNNNCKWSSSDSVRLPPRCGNAVCEQQQGQEQGYHCVDKHSARSVAAIPASASLPRAPVTPRTSACCTAVLWKHRPVCGSTVSSGETCSLLAPSLS